VRLIEPQTEADPVALLIQCLVAAGNAAGRIACRLPDNSKQHMNLFALVVGNSSKSRKGTSWTHVNDFYQLIDLPWSMDCISSGLSSGEGMIWSVHDAVFKREAIKEHGRVVDYQRVEVEEGVTDKRRLFVESEFVSVLKMTLRDGNTLSDMMRKAYDTGNLRTEVKNNPARATNAHLSVIGHITIEELLRYFDSTEAANGIGNRFLFACAERSKEIAIAKRIDLVQRQSIASSISTNIEKVRTYQGELQFSEAAYAQWERLYHDLSRERPGLLGSMLARAEAQVCRLAFIYALLDGSTYVNPQHLSAALALWKYCEQSVEYIFGDKLGDPIADIILEGLRRHPAGLTRTQINALFARNLPADQLHRALDALLRAQLVTREPKPSHGPELWRATKTTKTTKMTDVSIPATESNSSISSSIDASNFAPADDERPVSGLNESDVSGDVAAAHEHTTIGGTDNKVINLNGESGNNASIRPGTEPSSGTNLSFKYPTPASTWTNPNSSQSRAEDRDESILENPSPPTALEGAHSSHLYPNRKGAHAGTNRICPKRPDRLCEDPQECEDIGCRHIRYVEDSEPPEHVELTQVAIANSSTVAPSINTEQIVPTEVELSKETIAHSLLLSTSISVNEPPDTDPSDDDGEVL
jgi:hypothetical protein